MEQWLTELRAIEPTNSRKAADYYHYFLLRYGIQHAELELEWCDWVLRASVEITHETPPPPRVHADPAHGRRRRLRRRRGGAGRPGAASDVRLLADELERIHPNPYHAVSREEFRRQVDELAARADGLDRDELIVGLMRLMGLLGERDGHSGIYTLHSHPRPMHLYPVRVYWFADGLAAVGGGTFLRARSSSRSAACRSTTSSRACGR